MARETLRRLGIVALGLAASLPAGAVTAQADPRVSAERTAPLSTIQVSEVLDVRVGADLDRMVRFVDNGDNSDVAHVGNGAFPDELYVRGMTPSTYGSGKTAWGFKLAAGINASPSEQLDVEQSSSSDNLFTRDAQVWWYGGPSIGKFSLGRGPGVARYAGRKDASGTRHGQNHDNRQVESVLFRDGVGSTNLTVGDVFRDYQGERADRFAYYSPYFNGIQAGASFGNDNESEYVLRYDNYWRQMDELYEDDDDDDSSSSFKKRQRVVAALGVSRNIGQAGTDLDSKYRLATSASVRLNSGLSLTAAYGRQDPNAPGLNTNSAWYGKVGYEVGSHAFSLDYGQSQGVEDPNFAGNKVEGTQYGVAYQWNVDPYTVYVGAEQYQLDRKASGAPDPDNVRSVVLGAAVGF